MFRNALMEEVQIISFYKFTDMNQVGDLPALKNKLVEVLKNGEIFGTIILAEEGFNANLCGRPERIDPFLRSFAEITGFEPEYRSTFHSRAPFRKHEVKIKPEIVTFRHDVEIAFAAGTHVEPTEWNAIVSDPEVLVIDVRNDYEHRSGTFINAVNPSTVKFSELPDFVAARMDPSIHRKVAMFCTGGIRCEKFAPYLKQQGFKEIFQLKGGILNYLAEVAVEDQLWSGECFVFDERISLDKRLQKGGSPDLSQRHPDTAES
ncbi:MAG: rhodanese-like domain-containing protein [Pyrinomonadaceae bacterium]